MSSDKKIDRMYAALGRKQLAGIAFGSPIEEMLAVALVMHDEAAHPELWEMATEVYSPPLSRGSRRLCFFNNADEEPSHWASLKSQVPIGTYTVDFAIHGPHAKIAIECDGHDFHEKTKEQAAHDKKRDRYLQRNGWRVLRFTGSEIYRDAHACADEVVEVFFSLHEAA